MSSNPWFAPHTDFSPPPLRPRFPYVAPHLRTQPDATGNNRFAPVSDIDDVSNKFDDLKVDDKLDSPPDVPVEAEGVDIPPPATSFQEMGFSPGVLNNIRRCAYVNPTPIQRHAIPLAMMGRDLMACAQTGSGKTAAFCFPIINGLLIGKLHWHSNGGGTARPNALILAPTRELASQIHEEAKKFSFQTGLKVEVIYGGAPVHQQLRNIERGVDILVATPGRLVDLIERSKVSLMNVKYFALDEADRMFDMGFEPQVRKIVQRLDMPPPGSRQTLLFSATFPPEIKRLASDFLLNYVFLAAGKVGSSTDRIVQRVEFVQDMDKRSCLVKLLSQNMNRRTPAKDCLTLVFVETKRGADSLEKWLSRKGYPSAAIHGDKVQFERERSLHSFRTGRTPILVATDVAARGLDIPHVAHVINFDMPRGVDDYVHRIGRTGRAGKSGLATAFFNDKNLPTAKPLVELMQEANQEVPPWLVEFASRPCNNVPRGRHDYRDGGGYYSENRYADAADYPYAHEPQPQGVNSCSTEYGAPFTAESSEPYYFGYGSDYGSVVATGWE